ncbi:CoA-transferase [Bacillus sp. JJ1533]|uniref:CoA-transferase subunit beta n=1 Tax=Bacillus sp. JJ1533 TaxID=3122959 RepID=UPI002FFD719D
MPNTKTKATALDHMIVALAREVIPDEVTFNGVNSIIPMVAIEVARRTGRVPSTYINIAGGVDTTISEMPRSTSSSLLLEGSAVIFPNEEFYDLCARGGVDLVFLGAAQIDSHGRTNVSAIGDYHNPKVRLPGGGGASVLMPTAKRVVVWRTEHSPRALTKKLDFITSAGNVDSVVTPLCIFKRVNGRLQVKSVYSSTTLDEVVKQTGFEIDVTREIEILEPNKEELAAMEEVDPKGVRFLDWK